MHNVERASTKAVIRLDPATQPRLYARCGGVVERSMQESTSGSAMNVPTVTRRRDTRTTDDKGTGRDVTCTVYQQSVDELGQSQHPGSPPMVRAVVSVGGSCATDEGDHTAFYKEANGGHVLEALLDPTGSEAGRCIAEVGGSSGGADGP